MKGLQRTVRRALLSRLKASAPVTALVGIANIHGQAPLGVLTWPFIKTGGPRTTPRRAACLDGAFVDVPVHAFARARYNATGAIIETAEDHAGRIGEAIEQALDLKGEDVLGVRIVYECRDMALIPDGAEPDAFHYVTNVRARVTA